MHASSRNANDTWVGTKKDHFNGVGYEGKNSYRIDQNKQLCIFDNKTCKD